MDSLGLLGAYDIILAAETIYSLDSQKQMLECIKKVRPTLFEPCMLFK